MCSELQVPPEYPKSIQRDWLWCPNLIAVDGSTAASQCTQNMIVLAATLVITVLPAADVWYMYTVVT